MEESETNLPPLPKELLPTTLIKDEILHNILLFITLMFIGKAVSSLWKFRLYRKSVRKYAPPSKTKVPRILKQKEKISNDDFLSAERLFQMTVRKPKHAVGVKSGREFKALIRVGQHFAVRRMYLGYPLYHHILVCDFTSTHVNILHYNGEASVFLKSGSKIFGHVIEESIALDDDHYFDIPHNLFHISDPDYPTDRKVLDSIIERARQRIGENRYGITYNNCEHFVRWALTGKPHCDQYATANMNDKVIGAMVDELPNIGARMSMKLCKEVLFAITMGVEQVVLQNSARLIQHTASASVASILSTGAATFGWMSPVEAGFLTFRILDWKYRKSNGTMSTRDYNNAKDKAITGSVFSLVFSTLGAMIGQLLIPVPGVGAVIGSFTGGIIGRILGIVLAGYGIAVKEKYGFEARSRRWRLWFYRGLNRSVDRWTGRFYGIPVAIKLSITTFTKEKKL